MNQPPSDNRERDDELTAYYRAASADAPPAALDDAIRAAARRAVGARPRPAGFAFPHSWRVPLSVAAVMVLSVSMVTLLREEAPELAEPPRAGQAPVELERKPAAAAELESATRSQGFVPNEKQSNNIGLKPPSVSSPKVGMRQPESAAPAVESAREPAADRKEADVAQARAKRRDAPASVEEQRPSPVIQAEPPREAAKRDAFVPPPPASIAAAGSKAENKLQDSAETVNADRRERQSPAQVAAPALAAKPAAPPPPAPAPSLSKSAAEASSAPRVNAAPTSRFMAAPKSADATGKLEGQADLPPEKWLERIEALRKEGKLEEAKASLDEFRKRYPNYRLPDSLRDWATP